MAVTLVRELLHDPDWGHDRIRPEGRRLVHSGCFDAYVEQDPMFLSGRMSRCANLAAGRMHDSIKCS